MRYSFCAFISMCLISVYVYKLFSDNSIKGGIKIKEEEKEEILYHRRRKKKKRV